MSAERTSVVAGPSCGKKNRVRPVASGAPHCSVCHAPLPWVVEATSASFAEEVASSLPVLVDFWAPWCAPCRMLSPLVERLGREDAGRLKVVKLNVDEAPELAARYGAQSIPLLVLLRDGRELDRSVGAVPLARLKSWLGPHLAQAAQHA